MRNGVMVVRRLAPGCWAVWCRGFPGMEHFPDGVMARNYAVFMSGMS